MRIEALSQHWRTVKTAKATASSESKQDLYLRGVLADVAGKELFAEGLELQVHCGPTGGQPCRLDGDQILIDPKLLSSLDSRDELAFLLAQKAAFRLRGALSDGVQHGGDRTALKMMARAGFNPATAYTALAHLYQNFPDTPQGDGLALGLKTAADGREHEGLRMSVVQLEIEQMRRAGEPATQLPLQPLDCPPSQQPEVAPVLAEPRQPLIHELIDRAVERLSGGSPDRDVQEETLSGLLRAMSSPEGARALLPAEARDRLGRLLFGSREQLSGNKLLGNDFVRAALTSESLREFVNPAGGEGYRLLRGLLHQPSQTGLPQGVAALNLASGKLAADPELLQEMASVRERAAAERLRSGTHPEQTDELLSELFRSESWAEFSPKFEAELPGLLLTALRRTPTGSGTPQPLPGGLERRLCKMLEDAASPEERKTLTDYLLSHYDAERGLAGKDPRRDWIEPLHREALKALINEPPTSSPLPPDCAARIRETYGLSETAFPVADQAHLLGLAKRLSQGELQPDRSGFADDKSYRKARASWRRAQRRLAPTLRFAAKSEARQVLAPLALVADDPVARKKLLSTFTPDSVTSLLDRVEQARSRAQALRTVAGSDKPEILGIKGASVLLEAVLKVQDQVPDLESWYSLARRAADVCPPAVELHGARRRLGAEMAKRLDKLSPAERTTWVRKDHVLGWLAPPKAAAVLLEELAPSPRQEVDVLAARVARLDTEFSLRERHPSLYRTLRDQVCVQAKLQPQTVNAVFPSTSDDPLEAAARLSPEVAGLSGLLAVARRQPAAEQLATVEYLMGRQSSPPDYLGELDQEQGYLPMSDLCESLREQLSGADFGTRLLVADSFLAGPSGVLRSEQGRQLLMGHFLQSVRQSDADLVQRMAGALLEAQGDTDSLALAAVLAKKTRADRPQTQGELLSSFFDAYGVPGVKLKQYLAFTSQFEEYAEAFASAQDNANPVGPYEALKLLHDRFGERWPANLQVQGVIGSGSVNVAVRLKDTDTGADQVVSVTRPDIEATTRHDFARFKALLDQLMKSPEDREQFGFITGLLDIINDSIDLEFDKESARSVQHTAYETYRHHINGWNVRSIDAFRAESGGLFMELASGKSARKIKESDPEVYESAMSAMHQAELAVLRGQAHQGDILPSTLFANPDFHDGQVLIDEEQKTVTILDFGQAVPITNRERETALDLLSVFAKADGVKAGTKRLNKRFFPDGKGALSSNEVKDVLEREKPMGRFIRLLSLLNGHGADVPISSVHWLLGLNRQLSLGKALDSTVERDLKTVVIGHKLGLPLGAANAWNAAGQALNHAATGLALSGWLQVLPPL